MSIPLAPNTFNPLTRSLRDNHSNLVQHERDHEARRIVFGPSTFKRVKGGNVYGTDEGGFYGEGSKNNLSIRR